MEMKVDMLPEFVAFCDQEQTTAEAVLRSFMRDVLGVRDRAMLETLYSTGIRRMEIIGLQQRDVDYERGTLMVRQGKGKKDRMIPIGDRALAWVGRYRDEVRPELAIAGDDGTLFLTVTGQAFSDNRMTQRVRNHVRAAGPGQHR